MDVIKQNRVDGHFTSLTERKKESVFFEILWKKSNPDV